jgi:hypothetical protein
MDPTTPAPDDSERPIHQDDAEDSAAAEDRAADDGWAAEGEPNVTDAEHTAENGPTSGSPSSSAGTDTWRGPETTGRTPASIEPPANVELAPSIESAPGGESAPNLESAPSGEAAPSIEQGQSRRGTSDWRGPEAAGRTPASIEPAPGSEPAPGTDAAPIIERAPRDASELSESAGAASWRGPETSGWTPEDARLAPPAGRAAERTHEWPAADRGLPPSDDVERSRDSATVHDEPDRSQRVPAGFSFFNRARSNDDDSDDDADSARGYAPPEHLHVEERPRRLPGRRAAAPLVRADPAEICPFLVAAAGGWRLAVPSREHRCGAVNPPSPLSPQKQTRLCLTEGHLRCATFLAAGAARESRVGSAAMPDRVSRWALARTTPVVEEVGGVRTTLAGMLADRRRWPAIPAMLLVVALATLGLSSLRGGGAVTALASPSPQPTDVALPTATIEPTPTLAPTPEVTPSAAPTVAPTPELTPAPSHATYTVQSGDTLSRIAKQYGTTVQAIVDLNGITDPASLKIGQVLLIP